MEIGKILKAWRKSLGLSQTAMAAGVVSESYYSKVERGVHSIDAKSLIRIMKAHNLSVQSLFDLMDEDKQQESFADKVVANRDLDFKITDALNKQDVATLRKIEQGLEKEKAQPWYILHVKRIITMITHDNSELTDDEKRLLKKKMLNIDNWGLPNAYDSIRTNMWVLDFADMYSLVNTAYRRYESLERPSIPLEEAASSVADNFLLRCQEEHVDKKYTKSSIEFLRKRRFLSSSMYGFLRGTYYEAYFNGDQEKAQKIADALQMGKDFAMANNNEKKHDQK